MKILTLMPYSPVPPIFGGALRNYYLLKSLASEHEVTVVSFGTAEDEELFKQEFGELTENIHIVEEPWSRIWKRLAQCYSVFSKSSYSFMCNYSIAMQNKIDELLFEDDFDVVHSEFPYLGQYKIKNGVFNVLDSHNVEFDNYRRMWDKSRQPLKKWYYKNEYQKVFKEEIRTINKHDLLMATSKEDLTIINKDIKDVPAYVVPNGVDTDYFSPTGITPEPYHIVFTGMMGYTPNNDGMLWFLDEIFPEILKEIPQAKISIVGSKPPRELKKRRSKNIEVTGFVDDVRPYVEKAAVFVVPLRMGSGTRLKVVEALAMRKPVVSTSIGCEGIEVEHDHSILIQDDPKKFAQDVIRLLNEKELGQRLTKAGYELVTSTYDWSVIGRYMLDVYKTINPEKWQPQKTVVI